MTALGLSIGLSLRPRYGGGTPTPTATTWNPADLANFALSEGNLRAANTVHGDFSVRATSSHTTGKWYWEFKPNTADMIVGFGTADHAVSGEAYSDNHTAVIYMVVGTGWAWSNNGWASFDSNTVALAAWGGLAIDLDAGKWWLRRPAGWVGDPVAGTGGFSIANLAGIPVFPMLSTQVVNDGDVTANFGATAFAYTTPTGFTGWQL